MLASFLLVGIGGGFGSLLRYYISLKCHKHFIGTWIANISGSIFLGILVKLQLANSLSEGTWLFFGVGFCGGYTTFSTFGKETIQLIFDRKVITAIFYVFTSFFISILSVLFILII